jgi:hypothetical protein
LSLSKAIPSGPSAGGALFGEEKKEVGRAMRITPVNDMMVAICSIRVKGSLIRMEQTQQTRPGARKVRTVQSASGRYCNE